MEVVVSEPEEEAALEAPATADAAEKPATASTQTQDRTPPPVQTGGLYMLQMGSFRAYGDAERLKARLALLGVVSEIQVVDVTGGGTFHRVRSGPMSGSEANRLRARLQKESINSLVMKLKK
jgi:cell division protein FtsN